MARRRTATKKPPKHVFASGTAPGPKSGKFSHPDWFDYSSPKSCNPKQVGCQIKLGFKDGQTELRMCDKGTEVNTVVVDGPAEAVRIAAAICECAGKPSYDDCDPAMFKGLAVNDGDGDDAEFSSIKLRGIPKKLGSLLEGGFTCRVFGKMTAEKKKRLPASSFGIPGRRAYPMPDPSHAISAKGRAKTQLKMGKLSQADYSRVVRKANKVIKSCGGK